MIQPAVKKVCQNDHRNVPLAQDCVYATIKAIPTVDRFPSANLKGEDPQVQQKGIALVMKIDEGLDYYYLGDGLRVRVVLLNLAGNAVKFTERGSVTVHISENGTGLHFDVRDMGTGIPPLGLVRLFSSFSQVDASTTRRFGGTGLGLATMRLVSGGGPRARVHHGLCKGKQSFTRSVDRNDLRLHIQRESIAPIQPTPNRLSQSEHARCCRVDRQPAL